MKEPVLKQYENGLRLIFKKVEQNRPATLFIAVDVGSTKENKKNNGISHFIEHLIFKGTDQRTSKQISTELEMIGANVNAFTNKYNTCFFATCLSEKIENCFDIMSDIVFNSKFAQDEIDRERKVIFEEIDMYQDDPETVAYEQFCKDFYKNTDLERSVIGTKEILSDIKRQDIINFVTKNYVPNNIVVSVVGDFDLKFVENLVEKYISLKFSKKSSIVDKFQNKSKIVVPDKKFSFLKKDVAQTQIVFGFPCDNVFCDSKMAHNVLCFIFGGGMGSRLFQKVREENGLVYSINCMPELFEDGGDVVINLGTNEKKQVDAIKIIKEEIDLLLEKGFYDEEVERAKNFCKSLVVSSLEKGSSMAKINAQNVLIFNRFMPLEEKLNEINAVTKEQLFQIAKKVFNYANMCGCIVSKSPNKNAFKAFD